MKKTIFLLTTVFTMTSLAQILYEGRESEGFIRSSVFVIHYFPVSGKISSKRKLVLSEIADALENDEMLDYRFFSDRKTGEILDCVEFKLSAGRNNIGQIVANDKSIKHLAIKGTCSSVQVK